MRHGNALTSGAQSLATYTTTFCFVVPIALASLKRFVHRKTDFKTADRSSDAWELHLVVTMIWLRAVLLSVLLFCSWETSAQTDTAAVKSVRLVLSRPSAPDDRKAVPYAGSTFGTRLQERPSTKTLEVMPHASLMLLPGCSSANTVCASPLASTLGAGSRKHPVALMHSSCADVPLHDEQGNYYWLDDMGQKLDHDPNVRA